MTNATFYTPFGTKALGTVVIGDTIHEDAADILARDRGCEVVVNAALS
jgi:hypothetical protein